MTKLEKLNLIDRDRSRHHAALASLAPPGVNGLTLWRALRRIERDAHAGAEAYCNGELRRFQLRYYGGISSTEDGAWDREKQRITERVAKVFGGYVPEGFLVNGDPRGHALKLAIADVPPGMVTDWGGYGILAAEIND